MSLPTTSSEIHKPLDWRDWAKEGTFDSGHWRVSFAIVQRWIGSARTMAQPSLDHHYWVLHQGGPKRIVRQGGGSSRFVDAQRNAHTVVAAGNSYHWTTQGPIAFGHIYVAPTDYANFIGDAFDVDPAKIAPAEHLGAYDPLTAQVLVQILEQDRSSVHARPAAEHFLHTLLARHFELSSQAPALARIVLTRPVLGRVLEYIATHLDRRITVAELAALAGYSVFHFARAFRYTTGLAPYAYVMARRMEHAQNLLIGSKMTIGAVARVCGYGTTTQFATAFAKQTGVAPGAFRRARQG